MESTTANNKPKIAAAQGTVVKILVLGDPATGKTSIIKRYVHDVFSEHHKTTIGVDFSLKAVTVHNTTVRLQLWDIAGQEHYRALNRVYYKDALGTLLVYDVTSSASLDSVLKWKSEIETKVELPNGKPLPVILCANKCDLKDDIDDAFLDGFCAEHNFAGWFKTSAKDNINIEESAKALVSAILEHPDVFEERSPRTDTFRPTNAPRDDQNSWHCCY